MDIELVKQMKSFVAANGFKMLLTLDLKKAPDTCRALESLLCMDCSDMKDISIEVSGDHLINFRLEGSDFVHDNTHSGKSEKMEIDSIVKIIILTDTGPILAYNPTLDNGQPINKKDRKHLSVVE